MSLPTCVPVLDDVVTIDFIAIVVVVVVVFADVIVVVLLLSFAVSVSPRRTDTVFILLYRSIRDVNNDKEVVKAGRYECDRCGQVYRHRTSLRRHQRQGHTGRRTCPECSEVLQREVSLARHITLEHSGCQLNYVADRRLAAIPPPVTGNATVYRVVSDNWHAILSRHRILPAQDTINIKCWNGELQPYQLGVSRNDAWQTLRTAWRQVRFRCKVTVPDYLNE